MSTFATAAEAREWARTYGLRYSYRIVRTDCGRFAVEWNYREPWGC